MGDACNIKSSYMWKQNIGLGNAQWKQKVYVVLVYILFVIFYIIITISSPSLHR